MKTDTPTTQRPAGAASQGATTLSAKRTLQVPLLALKISTSLPRNADHVYLYLWLKRSEWGSHCNTWQHHVDAHLGPALNLSPRSLLRARNDLRVRRLLVTTRCFAPGQPTYYGLRWPPPTTCAGPTTAELLALEENPPSDLELWRRLAHHAASHCANAADVYLMSDREPQQRLLLAHRIQGESPWLAGQLAWADPDTYRSLSAKLTLPLYEDDLLPGLPMYAAQLRSCSTPDSASRKRVTSHGAK